MRLGVHPFPQIVTLQLHIASIDAIDITGELVLSTRQSAKAIVKFRTVSDQVPRFYTSKLLCLPILPLMHHEPQ